MCDVLRASAHIVKLARETQNHELQGIFKQHWHKVLKIRKTLCRKSLLIFGTSKKQLFGHFPSITVLSSNYALIVTKS